MSYLLKEKRAIIEKITIESGDQRDFNILENKLVFIVEGNVFASKGNSLEKRVVNGKIILLTTGTNVRFFTNQKASLIIVRLFQHIAYYDQLPDKEYKDNNKAKSADTKCCNDYRTNREKGFTEMDNYLLRWTDDISALLTDGVNCRALWELKVKELFYLFNTYYTSEILSVFFEPLIPNDPEFFNAVMDNYLNVKTIKELAVITNYSVSGFEKRFRKVFNTSAGQWLKQKKSSCIYSDIRKGNTPFKVLSCKYGFPSVSNFYNYCKLHFNMTPGEIRRSNNQIWENYSAFNQ